MKVSKHIHSCLLVEEEGRTVLLDPGNYSYEEKALPTETLGKLDAIGITHEHMDHMHIPWIKELVAKFPQVQIFSNEGVKAILDQEGIPVNTLGNEFLKMAPIPHEKIFGVANAVANVQITLFGRFATVGDSLTFEHSPEILALPIQAAWGSTTWAVDTALKVTPEVIIPIHDYHWKDNHREATYGRLELLFGQHNIRFLKAETGKVFEV